MGERAPLATEPTGELAPASPAPKPAGAGSAGESAPTPPPAVTHQPAPTHPPAPTRETAATWRVREATPSDARAVAEAVRALLVELGGRPAVVDAIEREAQALLRDPEAGALLVAESNGTGLVGVLGASWLTALHIPGRYGLIQELWVHPSWRGLTIGHDLLEGVFALASKRRIARVEVGLPSDGFAGLAATEAFYRGNGFELLGARMRRTLL